MSGLFLKKILPCLLLVTPLLAQAQAVNYQVAHSLAERTLQGVNTGLQAMEVAILVYNPKTGANPIQRGAHMNFFTGERFKLKVRSSYDGVLSVINIDATGKENRLSSAQVKAGQEILYPLDRNRFLEFEGNKGNEVLRLSLHPSQGVISPSPGLTPPLPSPHHPAGGNVAPTEDEDIFTGLFAPSSQQPAVVQGGAAALYGNAEGKAYVTPKGIREVAIEIPPSPVRDPSTNIIRPPSADPMVYEMQLKHF